MTTGAIVCGFCVGGKKLASMHVLMTGYTGHVHRCKKLFLYSIRHMTRSTSGLLMQSLKRPFRAVMIEGYRRPIASFMTGYTAVICGKRILQKTLMHVVMTRDAIV